MALPWALEEGIKQMRSAFAHDRQMAMRAGGSRNMTAQTHRPAEFKRVDKGLRASSRPVSWPCGSGAERATESVQGNRSSCGRTLHIIWHSLAGKRPTIRPIWPLQDCASEPPPKLASWKAQRAAMRLGLYLWDRLRSSGDLRRQVDTPGSCVQRYRRFAVSGQEGISPCGAAEYPYTPV